jgi:hypothetical protein
MPIIENMQKRTTSYPIPPVCPPGQALIHNSFDIIKVVGRDLKTIFVSSAVEAALEHPASCSAQSLGSSIRMTSTWPGRK